MANKANSPSREAIIKFRLERAGKRAKEAEMRFDSQIGDKELKKAIKNAFNDVNEEMGYIGFIPKYAKRMFLDNPFFNLLTERQYLTVISYIDALIELTFAQSKAMGLPNPVEAYNMTYLG